MCKNDFQKLCKKFIKQFANEIITKPTTTIFNHSISFALARAQFYFVNFACICISFVCIYLYAPTFYIN